MHLPPNYLLVETNRQTDTGTYGKIQTVMDSKQCDKYIHVFTTLLAKLVDIH
jgi:hypothetical protein